MLPSVPPLPAIVLLRRNVSLNACVRACVRTTLWPAPRGYVAHSQGTGRCRLPRAMLQKLQLRPGRRLVSGAQHSVRVCGGPSAAMCFGLSQASIAAALPAHLPPPLPSQLPPFSTHVFVPAHRLSVYACSCMEVLPFLL